MRMKRQHNVQAEVELVFDEYETNPDEFVQVWVKFDVSGVSHPYRAASGGSRFEPPTDPPEEAFFECDEVDVLEYQVDDNPVVKRPSDGWHPLHMERIHSLVDLADFHSGEHDDKIGEIIGDADEAAYEEYCDGVRQSRLLDE